MDDAASPVSVLIVDDQAPFRIAAAAVVGATPGFRVVGQAVSGEAAVEDAARLHPDVILMDVNMDGINGVEATRRIVHDRPGTVVLLLSTYQSGDVPVEVKRVGAAGYVDKQNFGPDVLKRIWDDRPQSAPAAPGSDDL
jgi:DNA-binding NarL/FixJ family response regulator